MALKRVTLFVSGNVQRAGYRDRVVELGRNLGLTGYAENRFDGRVKIVAEGEEEKLKLLEDGASIKNTLINVEKIESSFSKATGEFSGFFKLVKEGETDERLDTAAELLKELIEVTRNGFNETISAVKSVKEDTSAMLEKQDIMLEHTSQIPRIAENTSLIPAMKEDTASIRTDTREIVTKLWEKYEELSKEIAQMKITLSRIEDKVFG
jgi:acylphosphatase